MRRIAAVAAVMFTLVLAAPAVLILVVAGQMQQPALANAVGGAFPPGTDVGLDPEQLEQAARALRTADQLHAQPLPVLAMVVAALGESGFRPVPNGQGSRYCGVFQADPANVPCDDTEGQARSFLEGGRGFQAGGAIRLSRTVSDPGQIANLVEAGGAGASHYNIHRPQAELIIAAWRSGAPAGPQGEVTGTPKQVIDSFVLPLSNASGVPRTVAENDAANHRHGPTESGGTSDHQGPPDVRWAADMSNGFAPTPEMDRLATAIAHAFHLAPLDLSTTGRAGSTQSSSGNITGAGGEHYRVQLIYRSYLGGNHDNHVHLGISVLAGPPTP